MTTVTNNLNHSTWECKYHVVFTPKYRKKVLYGMIRRDLRDVFHRLAKQKECTIESGHLMPDHVPMLIAIPPKHSVATRVGFLKGKSSIWAAQNVANQQRNFVGHKFWARGEWHFLKTEELIKFKLSSITASLVRSCDMEPTGDHFQGGLS